MTPSVGTLRVLPPELGASLLAEARGLTLDAYLQTVITNQAATESVSPLQSLHSAGDDLDRSIDELFDIVQVPPGVGEGAMRRENWYR